MNISFLIRLALIGALCLHGYAQDPEPGMPSLHLVEAFPKLSFKRPVAMVESPDDTGRLFVVEQDGIIRVFPKQKDAYNPSEFLNIKNLVCRNDNEEGLLSLVFDPKYKENGYFYIYYTKADPSRNVIARYQVSQTNPDRADDTSEKIIIELKKPWGNHNGSTLLFGPDGYLYFSVGDGGSGGDPHGNGQNLNVLLGKIHRIDVHKTSGDLPYSIPEDNPFVGQEGARGEIWAYGLRNTWRMSFDRETGDLWGGDVGQGSWEEVNLITKGGNYGWNIREGMHPYQSKRKKIDPNAQYIDPITEYGRDLGSSITGGYVYRGQRLKSLMGMYLYADYSTGNFFALKYQDGKLLSQGSLTVKPKNVSAFSEDREGEIYVLDLGGKIFQFEEN